jgi:hypothetical protein
MNSQEMVIPLVSLEFHCDSNQVDANIGDYNETNIIIGIKHQKKFRISPNYLHKFSVKYRS